MRSSLHLLGSQYGLALIGVASSMIMLRLLTQTQFAVVATLEILAAVTAFSDPGLNAVVLQKAPAGLLPGGNRAEALGLIRLALAIRLLFLGILAVAAELLAPQVARLILKDAAYTGAIRWLVLGAVFLAGWESLTIVAQAAQEFTTIARWNLLGGTARQVVALLLFFPFGFPGYLAGLVGALALVNLGMTWNLRRYLFGPVEMPPAGATLRYAFPFWLRRFFRFGFLQFDLAAVGAMLRPEWLAVYGVARRLAGYVGQVTESFQTPILVRVASLRGETVEARGEFAAKATRFIAILIVPLCIFVAAASPWLMRVFGGEKYAYGWPILAILAVAQALHALYSNQALFVFVVRAPWATLLLDGISGLLSFGAVPLLILSLGAYGVGLAQILGFLWGIVQARLLLRGHPEIPLDRRSLRSLLIPLLAASGVLVGGQLLYFRLWIVPIYGIASLLLFVYLVRGILAPEERRRAETGLAGLLNAWRRA